MADQNVPQLTEVTTPADTDLLYTVVDPAGTPGDRKVTVANLRNSGAYAASPHTLGSADHSADTLASLNAKVSDATLDDASDTRTPASHGNEAHSTAYVASTGDETVAGIKTFSSSPIVPAPTTDLQAATKKYVDDNAGGGGIGETRPAFRRSGFGNELAANYGIPNVAYTGTRATVVVPVDTVRLFPFYTTGALTLTDLRWRATASAATNARIGIYRADNRWLPSELVWQVEVDGTAGSKTVTGLTVALSAGFYFLAFVADGESTLMGLSGTAPNGMASVSSNITAVQYTEFPHTYAALPAPPIDSFGPSNSGNSGDPYLYLVFARWEVS